MAAFEMVKVTTKYVSLFFAMRDNKSNYCKSVWVILSLADSYGY